MRPSASPHVDRAMVPGDVAGRRAVVMGLGRFGGGEAAARHLRRLGADVLVTDLGRDSDFVDAVSRLQPIGVRFRFGPHVAEDFANADLVVVNPAVPRPWSNPWLSIARDAGARLLTEVRLAIGERSAEHLVAITGTAGKSTTAAMTHHVLRRVRPDLEPRLGGNIGGSLLDDPPATTASIVLELSSFMLHWLAGDGGRPADRASAGVVAITNLGPNHLDWHESFDHYAACKQAIAAVTPTCASPRVVPPTEPRLDALIDPHLDLRLPGEHNRGNARLAVRLAAAHLEVREGDDASPDLLATLAAALSDFAGLPHRLEHVGDCGGVRCFNDSKATTPEATLLAVRAFPDASRIHLIAGGYDKGSDLGAIARLAPTLASLQAIGATADSLVTDGGRLAGTLEAAVSHALDTARPGDVLLLSPGCASWDQFANYEARGDVFRTLLEARAEGASDPAT